MSISLTSLLVSVACIGMVGAAQAQTIQTLGAGSAVHVVDLQATFNALVVNATPISDYVEGGLYIGTDGDSWVGDGAPPFDPFHGASGGDRGFYFPFGGSPGWTVIRATNHALVYGLEFMYGNGWTTGDIYGQYPWGNHEAIVTWQTWTHGVQKSSGVIGGGPLLEMGTIVGFTDPSGFDEIWIKCTSPRSGDPNLQALALDTLLVQTHWVGCAADFNADGVVDFFDYLDFVDAFAANLLIADFNADGIIDFFDYLDFVDAFSIGC